MRAVALTAAGTLEVVDKPEPVPGPDDVVLEVSRCGICGSDLHLKDSGFLQPGTVMGHEFAGTIVAVGDEVDGGMTGRRVSVLPGLRCGRCASCLRGENQLCPHQGPTSLGLGWMDGAYAEYVRVRAAMCHPLPDTMTDEQGALVEPYAVGLHAVRRSRADDDPDVVTAIIGAGPIGLMTLAALKAAGVSNLAVAEPSESRAAVAAAMGATVVVEDANKLTAAMGQAADLVFDCAGVPATPGIAVELVRPGGQVVLVGVVGIGEMIPIPGALWVVKEVDVRTCMAYSNAEFAESVDAVHGGAVDPNLVVSDIRPLEAADASFADLTRPGGPIKVLLAGRA
jgi:threonine dehydrogenase-like Zn-dependent dehydrogenase